MSDSFSFAKIGDYASVCKKCGCMFGPALEAKGMRIDDIVAAQPMTADIGVKSEEETNNCIVQPK